MALPVLYSEACKLHAPTFEIWPGGQIREYLESPERAASILDALHHVDWARVRVIEPSDKSGVRGQNAIFGVHDADYIAFIRDGYREWIATSQDVAGGSSSTYYAAYFPPPRWRRKPSGPKQEAGYGYYTVDLTAPLVEGTYAAAVGSARCAIEAATLILNGERAAYALCRPPGHHAGRDFSGGYCYFNNTAIAARMLSARGRVAVLDVDYHHGNGTQDIFWQEADVLTVSIHCDPRMEYPYFTGYADETGEGTGRGRNINLPLPQGTDGAAYLSALREAVDRISNYDPWALVVALGLDTCSDDPTGTFTLTTTDYALMAGRIDAMDVPKVIVQEGGYKTATLGLNVVAFLERFAD